MKKIDKIILHHSLTKDSGTVSWGAIRRYHTSYAFRGETISKQRALALAVKGLYVKKPWRDIGYHFGIEAVYGQYEILMGRMLCVRGAHTREHNKGAIGICFVGNFDERPPCQNQLNKGLELVRWLLLTYGLKTRNVFGHKEFHPGKTCPGKLFDLDKFRQNL